MQTSDFERYDRNLQVRQLHFNTENAYDRELTGGAFSIPLINVCCKTNNLFLRYIFLVMYL